MRFALLRWLLTNSNRSCPQAYMRNIEYLGHILQRIGVEPVVSDAMFNIPIGSLAYTCAVNNVLLGQTQLLTKLPHGGAAIGCLVFHGVFI